MLYLRLPWSAHAGNIALFVCAFCIILFIYGGRFDIIAGSVVDLFGTQMVGYIHGFQLTV